MLTTTELPAPPENHDVYQAALEALHRRGIEFLIGGGFGLCLYLQNVRPTKDLDVFVRAADARAALGALEDAGFYVEMTDPYWLAKGRHRGALIDVIFCSYNGLFPVGDSWFERSHEGILLGHPVQVMSPEDMILSKSFVAARDRFDGSDIAWLIRTHGRALDWGYIEQEMAEHSAVLLMQLVHCLYVFPATRDAIPRDLVERLHLKLLIDLERQRGDATRGPMLDPVSYLSALQAGDDDPRPREDLIARADREAIGSDPEHAQGAV